MFFRLSTDGQETRLPLEGTLSGSIRTACWIIGGGPSLVDLPCHELAASPISKFCINLAGHGLLRPTIWTAYDPTARFQRSVYLDPSILKILPRGRAMDIVPGTTHKVCDSPNTVFFDRERSVGFRSFLTPETPGITDWQDSLIQAIDIAYRLGFRRLYLAGCDMHVAPDEDWIHQADILGIEYQRRELLRDFHKRCTARGMFRDVSKSSQQDAVATRQYHFDEAKPLAAAIQTDLHYFRVAQYLRLSRRAMTLAGLEVISVTPNSRLNDYFPFEPVEGALRRIHLEVGAPHSEPTRGLYTEKSNRSPGDLGPMRDFKPHHWSRETTAGPPAAPPEIARTMRRPRVLEAVREIPVSVREDG